MYSAFGVDHGDDVSKAWGHSKDELRELGRKDKAEFMETGTNWSINNKEYAAKARKDMDGAKKVAFKAGAKEIVRHPVMTNAMNPNGIYRVRAVQRKAALEHKAKQKVNKRAPGGLQSLLAPYKGAVPKGPGIKQLDPAARPKTMALRDARRKAASDLTGRPGEAMR